MTYISGRRKYTAILRLSAGWCLLIRCWARAVRCFVHTEINKPFAICHQDEAGLGSLKTGSVAHVPICWMKTWEKSKTYSMWIKRVGRRNIFFGAIFSKGREERCVSFFLIKNAALVSSIGTWKKKNMRLFASDVFT